jgi:hypothetical protein
MMGVPTKQFKQECATDMEPRGKLATMTVAPKESHEEGFVPSIAQRQQLANTKVAPTKLFKEECATDMEPRGKLAIMRVA